MPANSALEQLAINTIRTLAMDGVQAANSGHPGTPMALAPVAYSLWQQHLRFDPENPKWPNRDRFVLSCGHASMLLYSVLHLAGVKQLDHEGRPTGELAIPLEHLKKFRQLGFRTPGHPESFETSGIETTTGPLGQGAGNSVGMAIASKWLGAHFNRPGFEIFDYNTYALCSDGDMMEGVSNEAASIAGHLKLDNLCWIYDDNGITIEGHTNLAFNEDVGARFAALGWNVIHVADANDLVALNKAFDNFLATKNQPTLIVVKSHIGWGSPHKQDSQKAHGEPLGADEVKLTKKAYGWPEDAQFLVPDGVRALFHDGVGARGAKLQAAWKANMVAYAKEFPQLAEEWTLMQHRKLPADWDAALASFPADAKGLATRVSSGKVLNAIAKKVPWLIGGSADLAPSTMTLVENGGDFEPGNYQARNFHWGIREHGMGATLNGMALSGVRPYGATFFVFTDYCRPSLRLSALMGIPVIWIFTHDSIGLGEDGPTHQPIEHLSAVRAIPNLITVRPSDANEVLEAWKAILPIDNHPVAFVLSRQNLPTIDRTKYASAAGVAKGAYILSEATGGKPQVLLMGTGSEITQCLAAQDQLQAEGIAARVVSMPSFELFEQQAAEYKNSVLPAEITARVACEAASQQSWDRYLGFKGKFVGMRGYGASAPAAALYKNFGITAENVARAAKEALAGK
ncbi:MAG TPA: transketolase [Pirellulales bacterium]|nr:transketolase [Pirellulales bacterium]